MDVNATSRQLVDPGYSLLRCAGAALIVLAALTLSCGEVVEGPTCVEPHLLTDLDIDPQNCGECGKVCPTLGGAPACQAGQCTVPVCARNYFDVDGDPKNGCECHGASVESCLRCGGVELAFNLTDDDCDGVADEADGLALTTRVACGADGLTCGPLPDGRATVCAAQGPNEADFVCAADPQVSQAWPGARGEPGDRCFDGVDDDASGLSDDGPACMAFVPNAAQAACNGAAPSVDCPPTAVALGITLNESGEPYQVALNYDFWIDRYEVPRRAFAAYLRAIGKCAPGHADPRCAVPTEEALRPIAGVTWFEAQAYCRWTGKRLPTEAEWARVEALGRGFDPTHAPGPDERPVSYDNEVPSTAFDGFADGPAVLPRVASEPLDVRTRRGLIIAGMLVADPTRVTAPLQPIHHITGNLAEWLFDRYVERCALPGVACDQNGIATLREIALNPVQLGFDDGPRVVRGGGFGSELGAERMSTRQWFFPNAPVPHIGFRCAATAPGDAITGPLPFDASLPAEDFAAAGDEFPAMESVARRVAPSVLRVAEQVAFDLPTSDPAETAALEAALSDRFFGEGGVLALVDDSGLTEVGPVAVPGTEALWREGAPRWQMAGACKLPSDPAACQRRIAGGAPEQPEAVPPPIELRWVGTDSAADPVGAACIDLTMRWSLSQSDWLRWRAGLLGEPADVMALADEPDAQVRVRLISRMGRLDSSGRSGCQ
ncbi:MAG: SUMF1/EgtB/PvdO family nonheme iron enzyme [Myxococcales bacterium]|nr:SUMF1/EgtB/PvdO family nonheme iron enzyme [Myxococcales bacterium]